MEADECIGEVENVLNDVLQTVETANDDIEGENLSEITSKVASKDDVESSDRSLSEMSDFCDKKSSLELPSLLRDKLRNDLPEVLVFITNLQNYIEKQKRKLKKLKNKFKKRNKTINVGTQTDAFVYQQPQKNCQKSEEKPKSIAEEIKEAAEQAMQTTGFVYEETSGLYYDYSTGYYYNAEYGLYYEAKTGTYMTFNADKNIYEFHSQVEVPVVPEDSHSKHNKKPTANKRKSKNEGDKQARKRKPTFEKNANGKSENAIVIDLEEGECSDNNSCASEVISVYSDMEDEEDTMEDVANQWPCMRIIVEESGIPTLKVGSLHILTYEGGTMGREGKHDIIIPDINVSKHHLRLTFDKDAKEFQAVDLGSRNGTFLNSKRMSPSKQESEPMQVVHGSKLQLGSVTLLCHVHIGNQTCGHCEPGLIQKPDEKPTLPLYNKNKEHKKELLKLKKKFAVNFEQESNKKVAAGYQDRAQTRRETIGSQNPHEKTEVASVHQTISTENKGFKMLSKLGWSEGQSLGKDTSKGITEPIKLLSNEGTAGLGSGGLSDAAEVATNNTGLPNRNKIEKMKEKVMKITQQRFDNAEVSKEDPTADY